MRKHYFMICLSLVAIVALLAEAVLAIDLFTQQQQSIASNQVLCSEPLTLLAPHTNNGIGPLLDETWHGTGPAEYIGVSDGSFAFDTTSRLDSAYKSEAAQLFREGKEHPASDCWNQAIAHDPNDAEAMIYRENQLTATSAPTSTITLIVCTTLTGTMGQIVESRAMLQGAYVEQEEYNRNHDTNKIKLLIANFGQSATNAATVLKQIYEVASTDTTVKGILGLPYISDSNADIKDNLAQLAQLHIPILLPSGSNATDNEQLPDIFHVAPSTEQEGAFGASYAATLYHRPIVFVDPQDAYSRTLATAFEQHFAALTGYTPPELEFCGQSCQESGAPAFDPRNEINTALQRQPDLDLLYFAGNAYDANRLLIGIPQEAAYKNLRVMGGDQLYRPEAFTGNYQRLDFTAFAFPDEWAMQGYPQQPFFHEYALDFQGWPPQIGYGYTRPNSSAILTYDALALFAHIIQSTALTTLSPPTDLLQGLMNTHDPQPYQGFSGVISFDAQRMPVAKTMLILSVQTIRGQADTQMICSTGRFLTTDQPGDDTSPSCMPVA